MNQINTINLQPEYKALNLHSKGDYYKNLDDVKFEQYLKENNNIDLITKIAEQLSEIIIHQIFGKQITDNIFKEQKNADLYKDILAKEYSHIISKQLNIAESLKILTK